MKVADLITDIRYGFTGSATQSRNGVGFIRVTDIDDYGRVDYLKVPGVSITDNEVKRYLLEDGDCIIARSGSVGKAHVYLSSNSKNVFASYLIRLRFDKAKINPKYFGAFTRSQIYWNQIDSNKQGGVQQNINTDGLSRIEIPLPDLKSQQKIAGILEKVDAARQKRKQANLLTEQFLQSAFLEMFGDPIRNEKGWEMKMVDQVVIKIISGWSAPSEQRLKQGNEIGVLKVSAVTYGVFKPEEHKAVLRENVKQNLVHPQKGDVLMTRANTREMVAACCVVDKDYNDLFLSDKHWKVIINRDFITADYFRYVIMSDSYHENLANKSTGTSGSMFNISKDKLLNSKFPLPPIRLQQKFSLLVEKVNQLRMKQNTSGQELENFFISLMQKYFG